MNISLKIFGNVSFFENIAKRGKNWRYTNVSGTPTVLKKNRNVTRFARNDIKMRLFGLTFKHCVTMCMNVKEEADKLSNFSHPSTDSDHFSRLKSTTFRNQDAKILRVKRINIEVKSTTGE